MAIELAIVLFHSTFELVLVLELDAFDVERRNKFRFIGECAFGDVLIEAQRRVGGFLAQRREGVLAIIGVGLCEVGDAQFYGS